METEEHRNEHTNYWKVGTEEHTKFWKGGMEERTKSWKGAKEERTESWKGGTEERTKSSTTLGHTYLLSYLLTYFHTVGF